MKNTIFTVSAYVLNRKIGIMNSTRSSFLQILFQILRLIYSKGGRKSNVAPLAKPHIINAYGKPK
jgi:hypothetical protein